MVEPRSTRPVSPAEYVAPVLAVLLFALLFGWIVTRRLARQPEARPGYRSDLKRSMPAPRSTP
jgi:hypothetical protein